VGLDAHAANPVLLRAPTCPATLALQCLAGTLAAGSRGALQRAV
jgi:hypothetical protein